MTPLFPIGTESLILYIRRKGEEEERRHQMEGECRGENSSLGGHEAFPGGENSGGSKWCGESTSLRRDQKTRGEMEEMEIIESMREEGEKPPVSKGKGVFTKPQTNANGGKERETGRARGRRFNSAQ